MSIPKFTREVKEYIGCITDWEDVAQLPGYLKKIEEDWANKGWEFSYISTDFNEYGASFYAVGHRPMTDKERTREEARIAKENQDNLKAKKKKEAEELELLKKLKAKYEK